MMPARIILDTRDGIRSFKEILESLPINPQLDEHEILELVIGAVGDIENGYNNLIDLTNDILVMTHEGLSDNESQKLGNAFLTFGQSLMNQMSLLKMEQLNPPPFYAMDGVVGCDVVVKLLRD
jgi:hypothetical protein